MLKNRSNSVNIGNQNRLHPFYMVYIARDGAVICDYLSPKEILDTMRLLCKGKSEPYEQLCKVFNKETRDGKNMGAFSGLLGQAVSSIMQVKEERSLDGFLEGKEISFLSDAITGLNDFELICFLVVQ